MDPALSTVNRLPPLLTSNSCHALAEVGYLIKVCLLHRQTSVASDGAAQLCMHPCRHAVDGVPVNGADINAWKA